MPQGKSSTNSDGCKRDNTTESVVFSLTPIHQPAFLARAHPPDGDYGQEWGWSCVVEIHGDLAYLTGAMRAPKPSEARELKRILRKLGFSRTEWERRNVPLARRTGLEL